MKTLTAKSKGETVQETEKSKKNPKKNPKKEQPAPTAEPSTGSATDPAPKAKDAGGILCEATEGAPPKKKLKGGEPTPAEVAREQLLAKLSGKK